MKHKFLLTDTLVRIMSEEKESILQNIQDSDEFFYTVQLTEEPGEVLITRMMSKEQIEEAVTESIKEMFPNKNVSNIVSQDVILQFKIYN